MQHRLPPRESLSVRFAIPVDVGWANDVVDTATTIVGADGDLTSPTSKQRPSSPAIADETIEACVRVAINLSPPDELLVRSRCPASLGPGIVAEAAGLHIVL